MNIKKSCLFLALTLFALSANAGDSCLESAFTQLEMNACTGINYQKADQELNRVYSEIRKAYADDPKFLEKMKSSQKVWIKLRNADVEMYFPLEDKPQHYGSVYPMCASEVKTKITLQRIEFLKQWLKGSGEGDICSGSIRNAWILKEN